MEVILWFVQDVNVKMTKTKEHVLTVIPTWVKVKNVSVDHHRKACLNGDLFIRGLFTYYYKK